MGDNGGYAGWTIAKLSSLKKSGTFSKASANFGQRFRHGTVVRLNVDEETAVLAAYGEHTAPNTPLAQQKNPIAQFTFDDEETGYTSDLAVAGIHGTAKLEDGNNGTKAARLGSGSWLSVTQTNAPHCCWTPPSSPSPTMLSPTPTAIPAGPSTRLRPRLLRRTTNPNTTSECLIRSAALLSNDTTPTAIEMVEATHRPPQAATDGTT